ncbi:NLP/P60 protein [Carbonactinospora thermoautotrophica]|uniref:NLP/P60 protein n=1 Tax=Carbonactinospora thermoautotrophica TaxID=1469144 RepID=A0A132N0E9_9ACTN|nr:NlpC/P60 family protein [Carbonactinospora thermoautotrophica]KWX03082.1 NLP/P60 protein [Carbonactinospora thermoautotrophica]
MKRTALIVGALCVALVGAPLVTVGLVVAGTFFVANSTKHLAPKAVPPNIATLFEKYGSWCPEINPALLAAQIYQESGFNPQVVSPAGARGIAQFMPGTWAVHGGDYDHDGRADVHDPQDAIPAAAKYDCELARAVKGRVQIDTVDAMLAAYNAGLGAVLKYGGIPPYEETRNYVKRIRKLEERFAAPTEPTVVPASQPAVKALQFAYSKLGTPYLWGGEGGPDDDGRFDCSGLTQAAYRFAGIEISRTSRTQWYDGPHVPRDQLQPGDLVFFAYDTNDPSTIHHVGIYVDNGQMIHAPYTGARIRFGKVDQPDYIGAVRIVDGPKAAGPWEPTISQVRERASKGRDQGVAGVPGRLVGLGRRDSQFALARR